jgi:para-aminobenzoate synthetase
MTTLLIDNYDSYTYNVFHLLAAVSGEEPIVVHNDMVSWRALSRWDFDAIVISPGPGRPDRWHDFGVCADILRNAEVPVLGVCLGHQGLGHLLDAPVRSAPVVMHGRLSKVGHEGTGLFAGIPQGFSVVRYHSLAVSGEIGPEGHVTAWAEDGVVMGIEHRSRPMWGVQFHPESVATEHGKKLFENFYALVAERHGPHRQSLRTPAVSAPAVAAERVPDSGLELKIRAFEGAADAEALFERLFSHHQHSFWLDSADAPSRFGRHSYLGASIGPERLVLEYDVNEGVVTSHGEAGTRSEPGSIFEVLEREIGARQMRTPEAAPPGFWGGFVGFLGYECKADCGSPNAHRSRMPDAVMTFANRTVMVDHENGKTFLMAVCDGDEAEQWMSQAEQAVRETLGAVPDESGPAVDATAGQVSFRCGRGRERYLEDIARCQAAMSAGESYEVCLTDQIHTDQSPDPWQLYRLLRRRNPAPFAAYLKLAGSAVLSSSPERFLSIDRDRVVQARPIKGTAPRSADPARDEEIRADLMNDEKTFAEHLMIVDLLRNDLGRVCEVDSVRVPELMIVESYPTVHQMISTVTGELSAERTSVDCVRACFPGGSMTGAPKLRTMEIIDRIEREARGVYSGAIGYFGLDGTVDLSIVIRTVVMHAGDTSIGAGGAIVMQSDPAEEFDEILLKARAPMAAIAQAVTGSGEREAWTVELEPRLTGAPR